MVGEKFGKWTLIKHEVLKNGQYSKHLVTGRCECGYETIISWKRSKSCKKCLAWNFNIGEKFGNWTIIDLSNQTSASGDKKYKCQCNCGNITLKPASELNLQKTNSCRKCNKKHGMSSSSLYRSYRSMIDRCSNPKNSNYHHYGGRGITVCDSWLKFENFFADMGNRPKGYHLDRIDNDKGYSLDNCKWVTPSLNQLNRRDSKKNSNKWRRIIVNIDEYNHLLLYRKQQPIYTKLYIRNQ